jgi:hypothetical protein
LSVRFLGDAVPSPGQAGLDAVCILLARAAYTIIWGYRPILQNEGQYCTTNSRLTCIIYLGPFIIYVDMGRGGGGGELRKHY